ncbi:efflux RND transporter periplasmic adaptor subunit [Mycoplana sp. MJR14]|uniref:efflux RND transporter periplasmic adaptor subunit n=1 Tax=Mycoplana sp. MJR14 TaxID=3032583 RepID=UPI000DDBB01F|nr:efflux RND transporter periplasmic adaptor subunit [Mycoplana sp. MJR14]MDF1632822.1 efflux RND transporter periplasmic adaptor subunit [Mycoplana sp. MJR14]
MRLARKPGALAALLLLVACSPQEGQTPPAPPKIEVGYVTLKPQSVPRTIDLRGRVVAFATAEVRPQVNGIVRKIAFAEGREVKAGDVLYEIDDAKFKAAFEAAEAALKKAEAVTTGAQTTYDRNRTLLETRAVSTQTLDDSQTALLQAQADQEAAKADLETARINLDYATIRAPIGGVIGVSNVSVGALVTENQTDALATIRQVDPIHVDLVDSSANFLRIREEVRSGRLSRKPGTPMPVTLTLENGTRYDTQGQISLIDMVVGQSTGTFTVRATFPNKGRMLIPGMFVSATVDLGTMAGAFLVPQRAVTRGDDGKATVYLVTAEGKAQQQQVTTSGTAGNDWIVTDGVKDGDRLIVDGFQKISDGSAVTPVEAAIDDDGVVPQDIETQAAETGKGAGQ